MPFWLPEVWRGDCAIAGSIRPGRSPLDVARDATLPPSVITVKIKASKTDPFLQGTTVHLGRTGAELCPVAALLSYIAARGLQEGPLFHFEDRTLLLRPALVREVLSTAGVDPSPFSGHSFRIGAATSAACSGWRGGCRHQNFAMPLQYAHCPHSHMRTADTSVYITPTLSRR